MNITPNIKEYLDYIADEVVKLHPRFTGNIEFKLNLKEGSIANMNCHLSKSVKV